jgi:Pentapeptide repeats (8 copies)
VNGCSLTAKAGRWDAGVKILAAANGFEWVLTPETWDNVAGLTEPFSKSAGGFQWLNGAASEVAVLISSDGLWQVRKSTGCEDSSPGQASREIHMEPDELLRRYSAGERDFRKAVLAVPGRALARFLDGAKLMGIDLSEADLSGLGMMGVNLTSAILHKANLAYARMFAAELRDANLSDADLTLADVQTADLQGANLRGANLTEAQLSGADLRGADLTGANVLGTDFEGAKLSGAIMPDGTVHA